MKNWIMAGIAVALLSGGMTFSSQAATTLPSLGYCGPENEGEWKQIAYYYPNGLLKQYYEFTCDGNQWQNTAYWVCTQQGYCTNLS
jgi:hypothetical protein